MKKLRGNFATPWKMHGMVAHNGTDWYIWTCDHKDGYTAVQVTRLGEPEGKAHYRGLEALTRKTGIPTQ